MYSHSFDPEKKQCMPEDFTTYFGNTIHFDKNYYNAGKYVTEKESELLKKEGKIVVSETKAKLVNEGYIPDVIYLPRYKVFDNTFSYSYCMSNTHKFQVYVRAMFADFIPASIMGLIIAAILSLIWKFNFKIRITK